MRLLLLFVFCCDRIFANIEDDDIIYLLNGRNESQVFNFENKTSMKLNPTLPIIIIVHGWSETPNRTHYLKIMNEYLKKYDCNVLRIDWSKITDQSYLRACWLTKDAGKSLGRTLVDLHEVQGVPYANMHVVSHSLGSQMAGFAGKEVFKLRGVLIGKITALDPAAPMFATKKPDDRLSKNDANSVIVLHTDGGLLGVYDAIGTVDLYANTGTRLQPGCKLLAYLENIQNMFCSHWKSYQLFAEAINNPKYMATKCDNWFKFIGGFCGGKEEILFEENLTDRAHGVYYFKTD